MMTAADRVVFLDTNILLTATTPSRPSHQRALAVLNRWPELGAQLCVSGQVQREYLVVATRLTAHNGLGLTLQQAIHNIEAMMSRCRLLEETKAVAQTLKSLALQSLTSGKQLHDANVVATALVHGVTEILTENLEDFARFNDRIKILSLNQAGILES
jgi:predicted nucleic acid-binding protein